MTNDVDISVAIAQLIEAEQLPLEFCSVVETYYRPLMEKLVALYSDRKRPLVVGVNGAQGSGKSTLAKFLQLLLEKQYGMHTASISIDDLYLTKAERFSLARKVSSLLATRGVPGTHDVDMGVRLINSLITADTGEKNYIPRFDKAQDDRRPKEDWDVFIGRADIVILEGWCVGANPQSESALRIPVNELERQEDIDGVWRRYVHDQLINIYPALFTLIDYLIMLKVSGFGCVQSFRGVQEKKLRQQCIEPLAENAEDAKTLNYEGMHEKALSRFIMHYERLTRHMLDEMPSRSDALLKIDKTHQICELRLEPIG